MNPHETRSDISGAVSQATAWTVQLPVKSRAAECHITVGKSLCSVFGRLPCLPAVSSQKAFKLLLGCMHGSCIVAQHSTDFPGRRTYSLLQPVRLRRQPAKATPQERLNQRLFACCSIKNCNGDAKNVTSRLFRTMFGSSLVNSNYSPGNIRTEHRTRSNQVVNRHES